MLGIILIVVGVILVVVGTVFIMSASKSVSIQETAIKINTETISTEQKSTSYNQDKQNGDNFEKYVVQKFNKRYFSLKEWTGDKYVNGHYAESTLHPDLLFEFNLKETSKRFAVECKWKRKLYKNGIELASEDQLVRYKKYEIDKISPVFMVIGLGGDASNPEHLFVIPLKEINTTFLPIEALQKYTKSKDKGFFFEPDSNILK